MTDRGATGEEAKEVGKIQRQGKVRESDDCEVWGGADGQERKTTDSFVFCLRSSGDKNLQSANFGDEDDRDRFEGVFMYFFMMWPMS